MTTSVSVKELENLTLDALKAQGYPHDEARVICDTIMYAQLRGNSQGVVKLIGPGMPRAKMARAPRAVRRLTSAVLLDGGQSQGMVALQHACTLAESAMSDSGGGSLVVGIRNTSTSSGALGYFTAQLAAKGFIALCAATSPPFVAAHGSDNKRLFGTNPIAASFPRRRGALTMDFATSATAFYAVLGAATAGAPLPSVELGYDARGRPTTDPKAVLNGGALRPMGGSGAAHKGYALALLVAVLGGALIDAKTGFAGAPTDDWGHFLLVIDPRAFTSTFVENLERLIARIEGSSARLPGDGSAAVYKRAIERGVTPIDPQLLNELRKAAKNIKSKL